MKIITLNKAYILLLLLTILFSCQENNHSANLLGQAQELVETNPTEALVLLDSIVKPEEMDRDNYMQYIVARVQAKYKTDQNVTSDTLIFEAQRYFEKKKNPDQAALAHFYTGIVYHENQIPDETLECFLQAEQYIKETDNKRMKIRIQQNIGDLYYEKDIMGNAITYYHFALENYSNEDIDIHKLQLMDLLGWAYKVNNNLDSALIYFSKGLELANKMDNIRFQTTFTHSLGVVYRDQKNYKQAINYLHQALAQTTDTEDLARVYLNLSITYTKSNQSDSARHYSNLLEESLSKITDNYVLHSTYKALSDYNQQSGDCKETLRYTNLANDISKKIISSNSTAKLFDAEKRYAFSLQEQEYASRLSLMLILGATLLAVIVSIACWMNIRTWIKRQKLSLENHRLKTENLFLTQQYVESIYTDFIAKWVEIKNKVKLLLGKEQKIHPSIFSEVDTMVEEIKSQKKEQLIELAKSYLLNYADGVGERAVRMLTDKDLILMMLCYFKYPQPVMIAILETTSAKFDLEERKLSIQSKLQNAGMTEEQIKPILFSKGFR